jgi:hypothetical protein
MKKMNTNEQNPEIPNLSEDAWAFVFLALIFGSEKGEDGKYVFKEEKLKRLVEGCDLKE